MRLELLSLQWTLHSAMCMQVSRSILSVAFWIWKLLQVAATGERQTMRSSRGWALLARRKGILSTLRNMFVEFGTMPIDGILSSSPFVFSVMLLWIMATLFCFNSWFSIDARHYRPMNCIRSWLSKPLFWSNFSYGYQGRMFTSKAIVVDSTVVLNTVLVYTFVCKGFKKYVSRFLNPGMIGKGVHVYQDICLRASFNPL